MADNKKVANSWENALAEHGKIPGTSLAVMIFILLVAFACTGVQVVTGLVEAEHAPEEIKGKYTQGTGMLPILQLLGCLRGSLLGSTGSISSNPK